MDDGVTTSVENGRHGISKNPVYGGIVQRSGVNRLGSGIFGLTGIYGHENSKSQ